MTETLRNDARKVNSPPPQHVALEWQRAESQVASRNSSEIWRCPPAMTNSSHKRISSGRCSTWKLNVTLRANHVGELLDRVDVVATDVVNLAGAAMLGS